MPVLACEQVIVDGQEDVDIFLSNGNNFGF
jgi:hypothetical protein